MLISNDPVVCLFLVSFTFPIIIVRVVVDVGCTLCYLGLKDVIAVHKVKQLAHLLWQLLLKIVTHFSMVFSSYAM